MAMASSTDDNHWHHTGYPDDKNQTWLGEIYSLARRPNGVLGRDIRYLRRCIIYYSIFFDELLWPVSILPLNVNTADSEMMEKKNQICIAEHRKNK